MSAVRRAVRAPAVRRFAASAARGRWLTKAGAVRANGQPLLPHLRYVLTSPELDTFSYDLTNEVELAEAVAAVVGDGCTTSAALSLFAELRSDDVLRRRIRRAGGLRPEANRAPLFGRQLARYALARLVQPSVVVECGVKHGLGSIVILRAVERNGGGTVIGIDPDPRAGWLVAPDTPGWERVCGTSPAALPSALGGRRVGMLVHDSVPDPAVARAEYEAALDAADDALVLFGNGNWSAALRDLAAERGFPCRSVREHPAHHFYRGAVQDLAVVRRSSRH